MLITFPVNTLFINANYIAINRVFCYVHQLATSVDKDMQTIHFISLMTLYCPVSQDPSKTLLSQSRDAGQLILHAFPLIAWKHFHMHGIELLNYSQIITD